MKVRYVFDIVILLTVATLGYFAVSNAVAIGDWWHTQRYTPPDKVARLAEDTGMNERGKKLFYRLSPQLVGQQQILEQCGQKSLGCTFGSSIYILDYSTEDEYSRSVVTAAHEMLHVAYSRLDENETQDIHTSLDFQFKSTRTKLLNKFKDFGSTDFYNEAHSYIGSEAPLLTNSLEQHYNLYFDDRSKVIQALKVSAD